MTLKSQRRLAAQILKISPKKIFFDPERLSDIKEAITKVDIRSLINEKVIKIKSTKRKSRSRARKKQIQKRKGRRKGEGSRKGKKTTHLPKKKTWILKVRTQRKLLKELKTKKKISTTSYRKLRKKTKGGFFRSKRHIKLFIEAKK